MSHCLSEIKIKNYKSIVECDFKLSDYTPMIGYNNAGKSNVINAIKWLIQKSTLSVQDFYDATKPVEIIGIVSGINKDVLELLDDKHKKSIEKYIDNESLTIRRIQSTPYARSADIKLYVQKPNYKDEEERWQANPGGIDNAIMSILPEPIHIGAMENAEEDVSKNKASTTIGKLLAKIIEPIEKTHGEKIKQELQSLSVLFDAHSSDRAKELIELDDAMNSKIDVFFQGVKVKVHVPTPELKEVFSKGTIKVFEQDNSESKDVSALGHGAQRSMQMALIQYLSEVEKGSENNISRTILLIDEPELYLHPQAIIVVREALKKLSNGNYQVIFSTHSPMLMTDKDIGNAILVRKSHPRGTHRSNTLHEAISDVINDKQSQLKSLFALSNSSEILFSETIILAEGKTEQRLLPIVFEAVTSKNMGSMRIGLVPQSGSGDTKNSIEILTAMGLRVKAIVDLDYAFKTAVSNKMISDTDDDYIACKKIMTSIANEHGIELGNDGWPTRKGKINSEQAFEALAKHPDASNHIHGLHEKLKLKNIWLWEKGAIESHLGNVEKNENGWYKFTSELLDNKIEDIVSDYSTINDCINWLLS